MQPRHPRYRIGNLKFVIGEISARRSMDLGIRVDWEKETEIHDGEYVHMGLRRTLQAIGIPMLAEV